MFLGYHINSSTIPEERSDTENHNFLIPLMEVNVEMAEDCLNKGNILKGCELLGEVLRIYRRMNYTEKKDRKIRNEHAMYILELIRKFVSDVPVENDERNVCKRVSHVISNIKEKYAFQRYDRFYHQHPLIRVKRT
jgi:hypothetical protein